MIIQDKKTLDSGSFTVYVLIIFVYPPRGNDHIQDAHNTKSVNLPPPQQKHCLLNSHGL